MNREEAGKRAAIMQAYADGKEIQFKYFKDSHWMSLQTFGTEFDFATYDYRVKPKPREYWLNIYPGNVTVIHNTFDSAAESRSPDGTTIHVREVLKDDNATSGA